MRAGVGSKRSVYNGCATNVKRYLSAAGERVINSLGPSLGVIDADNHPGVFVPLEVDLQRIFAARPAHECPVTLPAVGASHVKRWQAGAGDAQT